MGQPQFWTNSPETHFRFDEEGQEIFNEDELGDMKFKNPELYHLLSLPFHNLDRPNRTKSDWRILHLIEYSLRVVKYIATRFPQSNIVFMGHSLGGAVSIKLLDMINKSPDLADLRKKVVGIIVIDVVEGSALAALPHMHLIVKNR